MEPGILSSSSRTSTNHDSLYIFTNKVKELQKYKEKKKKAIRSLESKLNITQLKTKIFNKIYAGQGAKASCIWIYLCMLIFKKKC